METKDILNLIALVVIPIVAVLIGRWLQDRSEKRKDKMQIFKTLMTSRIYGWTPESVNALNIIDIVFANDKNVRAAWKLLEAIACSLGYKDKITWETIQNPYMPIGMVNQIEAQKNMQQAYFNALDGVNKIVHNQGQQQKEDQ